MPNNGRITVCPFYRDEKNNSISCEDVFRRFRWHSKKVEWMDRYCDDNYKSCPYAQDLLQMYEEIERGDEMAEEKHMIEALRKELKKTASMLGRAEKRLAAKDDDIKDLRKKKRDAEDQANYWATLAKNRKHQLREKNAEIAKLKNEVDVANQRLMDTCLIYEARFCYLMWRASIGSFSEASFQEWAKNKELHIEAAEKDKNGKPTVWKSVVKEDRGAEIQEH